MKRFERRRVPGIMNGAGARIPRRDGGRRLLGSRQSDRSSISANTGRPERETVSAVELKVSGVVTTSLPAVTPAAAYAQ